MIFLRFIPYKIIKMRLISIHNGHTSVAAYMEDGEVKFAIQEERFTKVKKAGGFPSMTESEKLYR